MKVIEKTLAKEDAIKIFDIIEETLKENRNTQVFVDNQLIWYLREHIPSEYDGYTSEYPNSHYAKTKFYHVIFFKPPRESRRSEFLCGHGHTTIEGYAQLLEFCSQNYMYYEVGFEQILKIDVKLNF